jgi:glycosyltransferase involved in cell wall biosynthesis
MVLVTNFSSFPERWTSSTGRQGRSVYAAACGDFLAFRKEPGAVFIVNCDPRLTLQLAAATLGILRHHPPLISVDIVLRRPAGFVDRLLLPLKRRLFSRADHYIHYFRDLRGLEEVFGIGPDRSSFVPFKVNLRERHQLQPCADGEYVLCFGRSLRDFDTFLAAMERLPYPAAIARPDFAQLHRNCARFTRPVESLPENVRLIEDDGTEAAQIRILSGARLLVLPILKASLVASGISTCLNALMLGKCVIGSEGPGMSDVFTGGEILTVSPEDPAALATMIERAWTDRHLRETTAAAGHSYALRAAGESELYARIIDHVVAWEASRRKTVQDWRLDAS